MLKGKMVTRYIVLLDDGEGRAFVDGDDMYPRFYKSNERMITGNCPVITKIKVKIPVRFAEGHK